MDFKYQFYPTLLDSFRYWKDHEEDESTFNDLIDKLNGVKIDQTEDNLKGIAFEGLINEMITIKSDLIPFPNNGVYVFDDFEFNQNIVDSIFNKLKRCTSIQSRLEGIIPTKHGNVRLYGIFDYEFPKMTADLKTTSNYGLKTKDGKKVKKYEDNFQHKFTSLLSDKVEFNYVITDFKYLYIENFKLGEELNKATIEEIEEFIDFINIYKYKIKDSKVFA